MCITMSKKKGELFNLVTDMEEQKELSSFFPEIAQDLEAELFAQLKNWNGNLPTPK